VGSDLEVFLFNFTQLLRKNKKHLQNMGSHIAKKLPETLSD